MSRHAFRNHIRSIEYMLRKIRDIVEINRAMPFFTDEDQEVSEAGLKDAEAGFDLLNEIASTLYFSDPVKATQIAAAVDFMTHGLLLVVSKSTFSESAFKAVEYKKSAQMRAAKVDDEKERVLSAAISDALVGKDVSERGMASKILGTINRQLSASGLETVSRHVVARRLKSARSSRA